MTHEQAVGWFISRIQEICGGNAKKWEDWKLNIMDLEWTVEQELAFLDELTEKIYTDNKFARRVVKAKYITKKIAERAAIELISNYGPKLVWQCVDCGKKTIWHLPQCDDCRRQD